MTPPDDDPPPTLPGADVPQPRRRVGRPRGSTDKAPRVPGGKKTVERAAAEPAHVHIADVVADAAAEKRGRERSFLRSPHGAAKERGLPGPRVEVPPADELAQPTAILPKPTHAGGPFQAGNQMASFGGAARRGKVALAASLGITAEMVEAFPEDLRRAMRKGASYRRERSAEIARMAGGECGAGASTMVASASLSLAGSRYVFALAALETDPDRRVKLFALYAKLADSSKQHELAAHSLAMLEAKSRPNRGHADPFAGQRAALPSPESNHAGRVDLDGSIVEVRPERATLTTLVEFNAPARTDDLAPPTSTVVIDATTPTAMLDPEVER